MDDNSTQDALWELYHENSKQAEWYRIDTDGSNAFVELSKMHMSLPHSILSSYELPATESLSCSLDDALNTRRSSRKFNGKAISFSQLATILNAMYGTSFQGGIPRPLKSTPSGGSRFPLEFYIYIHKCADLPAGWYHFHHENASLGLLKEGQESIGQHFVQSELLDNASALILTTAVFQRSIDKYGERGYRLVLLEAGHAAQNANLAATAVGIPHLNVGAFYDHSLEEELGLDGLQRSVIYAMALGGAE